jgi:hypothetical protein
MITPPVGAQVYLAITPVDMRRGIFGLASLVEKDFGISLLIVVEKRPVSGISFH